MLTNKQLGSIAFDVLGNKFHLPLVDGKANRDNIEEEFVKGIYSGELCPMSQDDADLIIELINGLLIETGNVA